MVQKDINCFSLNQNFIEKIWIYFTIINNIMKKIVITGGAGFIGSHLCEKFINNYPKSKIIIIDKLTYAGNKLYLKNVLKSKNVKFYKKDILNHRSYDSLLKNVDLAINVAAESHVDVSFNSPLLFSYTNTVGAHTFLLKCIEKKSKKNYSYQF